MNPRIMDALPTELAGAVFDQLTLKHMVAASGVCKDWRRLFGYGIFTITVATRIEGAPDVLATLRMLAKNRGVDDNDLEVEEMDAPGGCHHVTTCVDGLGLARVTKLACRFRSDLPQHVNTSHLISGLTNLPSSKYIVLEIDLGNITSLTSVALSGLTLKSLVLPHTVENADLSGCRSLVDLHFSALGKPETCLSTLDISGCKALSPYTLAALFPGPAGPGPRAAAAKGPCRGLKTLSVDWCLQLGQPGSDTMPTPADVVRSCPLLSEASMRGVADDEAVMALAESAHLSRVNLAYSVNVKDAAVATLLQVDPKP
mmetsp:Transcript_70211/g.222602  ORF Transcript_70211/g.222602 Transcript_70211/m.222602 type:complete len:315 (-) Transcript_70211:692-1636(-)